MEEDSFNQTFLTIENNLFKGEHGEYAMLEKQKTYNKENSKNYIIIYKNETIAKLHSFIIEEDEFMEVFTSFKNNQLIIPDNFNPTLIPAIIHYFYFKEIKQISIKLIFEFLDLSIFLNVNELIKITVDFLKNNLTDTKKVNFIRKNIFPFIFIQTSNTDCQISKVFDECELYILQNERMDDYLSFYALDYFQNKNVNNLNLEEELIKRLKLMDHYKINGLHLIKLLLLFKDKLISFKQKNESTFDFKVYAEKKIENFVKLNEMDPKPLNDLLYKLEMNTKDFQIKILSERITFLENEIANLKNDQNLKLEELKNDYNKKHNDEKQE